MIPKLTTNDFVFFTTREYALHSGQSTPSASRTLHRMAERGWITKVVKGVWANTQHPYFTPLGCVPFLLGREHGYVSFLTALQRHGAISQLSKNIQVATTAHPRKTVTPIGVFEFFQVKPEMMRGGVDWSEGKCPYRIASPEKALLDTLYISTRKGKRFAQLPELDFDFKTKKLHALIKTQIQDKRIRSSILRKVPVVFQA